MKKMQFLKICLENYLGFGRLHENIKKYIFSFFKKGNYFKRFAIFLNFLEIVSEKIEYFNTGFVFYSVETRYYIKLVGKHLKQSQFF
jgi:hypothetical protein